MKKQRDRMDREGEGREGKRGAIANLNFNE